MQRKLLEADELFKLKNFDAALPVYKEILQEEPSNISALGGALEIMRWKEDFDGAVKLCNVAVKHDPTFVTPYVLLAHLYYEMQDINQAMLEVNKALKLEPDSYDALCFYGLLLWYESRYQEAIKYLRRAVEINYDMYLAHDYLSACYQRVGATKEFRRELLVMQRLKPNIENFVRLIGSYFGDNKIFLAITVILPIAALIDTRLKFTLVIHAPIIMFYILSGYVYIKQKQSRLSVRPVFIAMFLFIFDLFVVVSY